MLDNFQPLLLNDASGGRSWNEHGVHKSQIYKRNEKVQETSEEIWNTIQEVVESHIAKGNIIEK